MIVDKGVARLAAIVYFIQGSLGIASIALPLYMRAQGLSIATITLITSVSTAPWFCKILYGALSDSFPINGLRRKPYLIICSGISCLGWLLISILPPQTAFLILGLSVANLGLAATDVITDGLVVEHSVEGTAQLYQGISWGSRSVGSVLAGVIGGFLAAQVSAPVVFSITAALPLISLGASFFLEEQSFDRAGVRMSILSPIVKSLKQLVRGDLKWFSGFLFVASCSAAIGTPLFFYMREQLRFDEVFLGILGSVGWLGAILGCIIFLLLSRVLSVKQTLYGVIGLGVFDVLLTLLIQSHVTAFAITLFSGILGFMIFLPLLSAAAKLSHGTGVESSLFAVLASLYNLGLACSGLAGGLIYEWIGLHGLILVTAVFLLSGFFIVPRMRML
ncbi:MAG: hypothetical protein A3A73_04320 [Omnitrophica bacterium RIFCSPLOWO2_01_FULL_50_24]|nr:MAG: hypothetical protein A3A73_04320 [Omnitrophica bacterium RIFCSPLOWO2_01_FULL_50_24]